MRVKFVNTEKIQIQIEANEPVGYIKCQMNETHFKKITFQPFEISKPSQRFCGNKIKKTSFANSFLLCSDFEELVGIGL